MSATNWSFYRLLFRRNEKIMKGYALGLLVVMFSAVLSGCGYGGSCFGDCSSSSPYSPTGLLEGYVYNDSIGPIEDCVVSYSYDTNDECCGWSERDTIHTNANGYYKFSGVYVEGFGISYSKDGFENIRHGSVFGVADTVKLVLE